MMSALAGTSSPIGVAAPTAIRPTAQGRLSRLLDTAWKRVTGLRDLPARTALRVTNLPSMRRALGARYDAARAKHRATLPRLTGIDREIVAALRRDGVFITSLDALSLAGSDELMRSGSAMVDAFADEARARVRAGSDFNVVPPGPLLADPELFRWGLSDRLLAIAEAYLELPVAYDGPSVNYTVADGREVSTRKWHRDWEDRRMLKVAVYLNDVDADGGPFQMIKRADAVQTDADGFGYELATDQQLQELLGADFRRDIMSCEGEAGTVVFTDTAGFFHRGKPATARDRGALFFSYFARTPRHPFFCERSGLSRRDIATLARGLTEKQRAATFWRQSLPLLVRLIPPARI